MPTLPLAQEHHRQEGRRARGRQDVTCADQAPAPTQLRGGNALSHSYERSSLLEGRRRAQSHTIPRLSATRAGVGRWVPEAWGPQQSPPAREPAPRHTIYLGHQAGKGGWDLTPKPASKQHRLVGVTSWPGKSLCPRVVLEPATPETPFPGQHFLPGEQILGQDNSHPPYILRLRVPHIPGATQCGRAIPHGHPGTRAKTPLASLR